MLPYDQTVCTVASGTPELPLNQFKTHAIGPPVTPRPGGMCAGDKATRITNLSQKVLPYDQLVCTVASGTPELPLNQFKTHAIGPPLTPRPGGHARVTGLGGAEVPESRI